MTATYPFLQASRTIQIDDPSSGLITDSAIAFGKNKGLSATSQTQARHDAYVYFTLTTPYCFCLTVQRSVPLPDVIADDVAQASGSLYYVDGGFFITQWPLATVGSAGESDPDFTLSGILMPGTYYLDTEGLADGSAPSGSVGSERASALQSLDLTSVVPEPTGLTPFGIGAAILVVAAR